MLIMALNTKNTTENDTNKRLIAKYFNRSSIYKVEV